jgi:hypothetical protein
MTRKAALAFGIGASLMLAAGTASAAGTCGTEVAALQQQLGLEQGANARTGPSDTGAQQPSPGTSVDTGTSSTMDNDQIANSNSGANATIGASDPGVQQPQPEANATTGTGTSTGTSTTADSSSNGSSVNTNNENSGANATIGATDPGVQQPSGGGSSDVQAQNNASGSSTTMPSGTVTETSRAGDLNSAAGGHAEAVTALKKAQLHADAGEEDACMTELNAAKTALGIQ